MPIEQHWIAPAANVSERRTYPPQVGVSTVILALRGEPGEPGRLWMPLVRRTREPFRSRWALPGGALRAERSLDDVARETLGSVGLRPRYLEQLYTFGDTDRSPGLRMVSIVYWALVDAAEAETLHSADAGVRWFPADDLPELAFDHQRIIDYALWRLQSKMASSTIAARLIGERFTVAQLRQVYEAVLGRRLDPANFRRRMLASGLIEPTEAVLRGGRHRPARLYRYAELKERTIQ